MKYKIGVLAKIFEVSVETIRYYESKGIITPQRDKSSNYRLYDGWDVFSLFDANIYRKFNFSIHETDKVLNSNTIKHTYDMMNIKIEELANQIEYQKTLLEWMQWWRNNMEESILNFGSVSIKQLPEMYFKYTGSKNSGDDLSDYDLSIRQMREQASYAPYCIPTFYTTFKQMRDNPEVTINRGGLIHKKYYDKLKFEMSGDYNFIPKQVYLSYTIDLGNIGSFNWQKLEPAINYIEEKGYDTNGDIYGIYIARFKTDNEYHRYLEIIIPVTSDNIKIE